MTGKDKPNKLGPTHIAFGCVVCHSNGKLTNTDVKHLKCTRSHNDLCLVEVNLAEM